MLWGTATGNRGLQNEVRPKSPDCKNALYGDWALFVWIHRGLKGATPSHAFSHVVRLSVTTPMSRQTAQRRKRKLELTSQFKKPVVRITCLSHGHMHHMAFSGSGQRYVAFSSRRAPLVIQPSAIGRPSHTTFLREVCKSDHTFARLMFEERKISTLHKDICEAQPLKVGAITGDSDLKSCSTCSNCSGSVQSVQFWLRRLWHASTSVEIH